jgi:ketosteroid isomerase-like protein
VTQIPAQEEKKPELPEETEVKKEELEVSPAPEEEVKEEHPQTQIPEQEPTKKRGEDFERRISLPKKRKRDYRRLFREAGGITIMVVAGGYFLWAIYSHLMTKPLEPKIAASKEVTSQVIPNSLPPAHPATSVTESEESKYKKTEESSSISKEVTSAVPASPSLPDTSKMFSPEMQEIENIKALLENIRQANLQKNIDLFISCYATDFKDREGKKKATLAYWKKFDYLDLSYDFKNPSISGDTAKARVEWLIKISPTSVRQPQESKTILDVTLKKEEGGWKIKEVKQGG